MASRYLTKSRFKLALECPTKLYYTGKKQYPDKKIDDSFLKALAEGGYQVGELAKCYFPDGTNIDELDYKTSLLRTEALLKNDEAIIYEAAFSYENLFIRADIVVKKGIKLYLYEVKAKSYNSSADSFTNTKGIVSKWKPYIYDVAFQKYVIQSSRPDLELYSYLMLADKSKVCTVDGLNQKFVISSNDLGRIIIETNGDISPSALGDKVLCTVNVDEICNDLLSDKPFFQDDPKSFQQWIHFYADHYQSDDLIQGGLLGKCGKCEYQSTREQENDGFISGYKECWKRAAGFSDEDFDRAHILVLWDFKKKDAYLTNRKYFLSELTRADLEPVKIKPHLDPGLSRVDRQWMQISKSLEENPEVYFDHDGMNDVFEKLIYPLHFIDFETTAVAIPFSKGRKPYEQVAFQFSHHIYHKDGSIEHADEWLDSDRGRFPNFVFIRKLKETLEKDNGSIFRYSNHENTILNKIHEQLSLSSEPDSKELCDWIKTITHSTGGGATYWKGDRDMVDLWDWVKKYYFASECCGSNSIKQVLPAVLNSSEYLKSKYSNPIYGNDIQSLNFSDQIWIRLDENGKVKNPYKLLEPIFEGVDQELLDAFVLDEEAEINDGGAAMTAYARMQFSTMNSAEIAQIRKALLRYCELDTLAMVMIFEDWNHTTLQHAGI
jgi:hypothetical protein